MVEVLTRFCPTCAARYEASASYCRKDGTNLRPIEVGRDPLLGQTLLGQFRIEEKIGLGGMGVVYRAHQTTMARDVAIKILHPDLVRDPDALRRFKREGRISLALDHPNVVRVFLFGQLPDGNLYLVMELLRGRLLSDLLRAEPHLSLRRALTILTQVADGMGEAHQQGIVHRDVKPENVFLAALGRDPELAKLIDFGIARMLRPEDHTTQTPAGLIFGTAKYISPEGAAGEPTDARSDVYSLGVLGYQLLSGVAPFDAARPVPLLMMHLHEPAPPLRSRSGGAHVPPEIADVVMRALSKEREERYEDADALAEALREAAHRAGVHSDRPRTGSSRVASATEQRVEAPENTARAPARFPSASWLERIPLLMTLLASFVLGALGVLAVAVALHTLRAPTVAERHAESVRRAEAALTAHHWDGPDGVHAAIDVLRVGDPNDADAARIEHAAAQELVVEGNFERQRGQRHAARSRYEAALGFVADEPDALAGIEALEASAAARLR